MEAAIIGSVDILRLLFRYHASVFRIDRDNNTALHLAAERGHVDAVDILIQEGLPLNVLNKKGYTPLMLAAENGHYKVVRLLIARDASAHCQTRKMETALTLACSRVCLIVCFFLKKIYFLSILKKQDRNKVAKCLLTRRFTTKRHGNELHIALSKAIVLNEEALTRLLLAHGADVNHSFGKYPPAIFTAILHENRSMLRLLLEHQADIEKVNSEYDTPLLYAVRVGNEGIIRDLLDAGAKCSYVNPTTAETALTISNPTIREMLICHSMRPSTSMNP